MAPTKNDSDCPDQVLWTFPAPGNSSLMPDKHPQSSSFKVEQYLETSAHHPPTSGFGVVPLYVNDVVEPRWPSNFDVPHAMFRNLYCKPCQQDIEDKTAQEDFDWKSCYERAGHGGIWSRSIDVMGSGMSKVPVKFSFTVDADALVCAFGFPGTLPGGLSQAFPVINKQPPSDRGRRLFTFEAPEGVPYEDDEAASLGMHYVIGCMLVFALCMALFARVFSQKRKQRKVLKALIAQSESDDVRGPRKTRYTDDS